MWERVCLIPWPSTLQQRRSFPCLHLGAAIWSLLECAAELCRCSEGSLWMTEFVWVCETSSRLSCLCMSFCGRVARHHAGSWTGSVIWSRTWMSLDWALLSLSALPAARIPGETGLVRPKEKKRQCFHVCVSVCTRHAYLQLSSVHKTTCIYVCVYLCVIYSWLKLWLEFCRASCPEPHTVFPVGFPCSPLGCFCVFCVYNSLCLSVCVCECVTTQLKQPLHFPTYTAALIFFRSSHRFFGKCRNCSTQPRTSRRAGAKEWKLLIKAEFSSWCPVSRIVATLRPWFLPLHRKVHY